MKVSEFCKYVDQVQGDGSISIENGCKRLDEMKIGFGLTFFMRGHEVASFNSDGLPETATDLSLESIPVYLIDGEWHTPDTNFQRQLLLSTMKLCGILKGVKLEIECPKDSVLDGAGFLVPSKIQVQKG